MVSAPPAYVRGVRERTPRMSLNEPNRPTPNTYVRQVIDQVQR